MNLNEEMVSILQIFICDSLSATIENISVALQCGVDGIEKETLSAIKDDLEKITETQFLQIKSICKKYIIR